MTPQAPHKTPSGALQRILVIRLSSLGDILLTTPVLRLLRDHCPEARIDFLLKSTYQDLLSAHSCVDRLILFDESQPLWQTIRTLRQTSYDLVLDLHRTLRSRLLFCGLVARRKLAYNKRTLRRALLVQARWNTLGAMTPVPELYAAPLRRLGIMAPLPHMAMHLAPGACEAMQSHLDHAFPEGAGRPLLALAPGARWPTKRWPAERFAAVAQEVVNAHGAAVVILGDQNDTPLARDLGRMLKAPIFDAAGTLSLMQTAALLQRCRLLLSNDSGLMHMATALDVAVVAIFGPTVQEFGFYPFQARADVVSAEVPCRPCHTKGSRRCPQGHHQCMLQVSPEPVLGAVHRLWDTQRMLHDLPVV